MASAPRIILVTGSTDGIGLHTAKRLAAEGYTVLVHGRNVQRVSSSVDAVKQAGKHDRVHGLVHDLASLGGVRALASDVTAWLDGPGQGGKLDLINNAGVFETTYQRTVDGFERTWAVNVLAPYLLTSLLLDRVDHRIINASSISAGSSFDWDNLNQEKRFSAHNAYAVSKLAMMAFTLSLADAVKQRSIVVNCLDPGTVDTKTLHAGWGGGGIPVGSANDEFALATDPAFGDISGAYFVSQHQRGVRPAAADRGNQARLWRLCEEQTGAVWS